MKLMEKQIVEATSPTIHIGKRTYRDKRTREERVNGPYWAEYFTHGRQHQESLVPSRIYPTSMSWNGWATPPSPFWTCISR
jgi:hypothetical protein